MKKISLVLLFAIILVGSFYSQPKIIADDNNDDKDHEFDDGSHDRELKIEVEPTKIKMEAELKNGTSKDKIAVEVSVESNYPSDNNSGQAEFRFKYKKEANSTEIGFKYRIELIDLIEYVDNGTFGNGYQPGEEVSTYNIGGSGWNDLVYVVDNVTVANVTKQVNIFKATTLDGVVSLIIRVAGGVVNLGNSTLTPNSVKFDVQINNFPYTVSNSSLAIKSKVKSGAKMEVKTDTADEDLGVGKNETEINLQVNGTQGYFSWADTAIADGQSINVIDSPIANVTEADEDIEEGESNAKMYFSFNATNATSILWDPKVGVVSNDVKLPSAPPSTDLPTTSDPITSPTTTPTSTSDQTPISTVPKTTGAKSDSSSTPGFNLGILLPSLFIIGLISLKRKSNK